MTAAASPKAAQIIILLCPQESFCKICIYHSETSKYLGHWNCVRYSEGSTVRKKRIVYSSKKKSAIWRCLFFRCVRVRGGFTVYYTHERLAQHRCIDALYTDASCILYYYLPIYRMVYRHDGVMDNTHTPNNVD